MKSRNPHVEAQRRRFEQSCLSCLRGDHDCNGNLCLDADGNRIPCECGCFIEPWPWPTGDDESPVCAG